MKCRDVVNAEAKLRHLELKHSQAIRNDRDFRNWYKVETIGRQYNGKNLFSNVKIFHKRSVGPK